MLVLSLGHLFFAIPAQAEEPAEPVVVVVTTPGGDDSSYQVPLTTTVTFDGVQYNSVYATTNSVITFGRPDGTYWDYPTTPSISLYSMDWVVYPQNRTDEHLIIRASDGGFQVDIAARPIWLQNAPEVTNINIVAAINTDGTVSISYSLAGPTYEGQTRTGVRLTDGSVVTLEQYGVVQVEEPPVLEPEPVAPTPTPEPTPTPTPEPTPTPTPEPTPTITPPTVPQGATILSEGSTIEVVAPAGQRIVSVMAWYGDPNDSTRGIDVSSNLTQLASGQTSVTIESSNIYGDPAGGTVKVLIFLPVYENIPAPEPIPTPTPQPTVDPAPPVIIPDPVTPPTPEEPVEPTPEPTVEPTIPPTEEPTPEPTPSEEPAEEPTEVEPEPLPEPDETAAPEIPVTKEEAEAAVEELAAIAPEELTDEQAVVLLAAAEMVLETALEGSKEYEAALDALAVVAQADDPELPAELAAIPGAAEVLEAFNALGNMGADMSPATREEAEKIIVAGVVAVNAALSASLVINAGTRTVAPAAPAPTSGGSGGAPSSGSGSAARRKV